MYDSAAYSRDGESGGSQREISLSKISITSPISIWVILMIAASFLKAALTTYHSFQYAYVLNYAASFVLLAPGMVLFPLAIGLITGMRIGNNSGSIKRALNASFYCGIYNSIIFMVAILVVYEIILYASMLPSISFMVQYWIALPVIMLILLPSIISTATYMTKKASEDMKKR